jgi:RNA polymerase sigma factor (sigma-70 family)
VLSDISGVAGQAIIKAILEGERQVRRSGMAPLNEDEESLFAQDLLPSPDAGPEAAYARSVRLEELDDALDELPENQREVLVAHELMGYSFKELAAHWDVSVNTLLSPQALCGPAPAPAAPGHLRRIREEMRT